MARIVEQAGGAKAALGVGLAGLIGIAGITVAIALASCEVSSRTASRPTPKPITKSASMPRVDPNVESRAGTSTIGAAPAVTSVMSAPLPTSEPQMRVRIVSGADTVRITCPGGVEIGQGEPKGTTTLSPGAKTDGLIEKWTVAGR